MYLLTITATSIDRLLAFLLGLRYRQVVTLKGTYQAVSPITILWVFSIVLGIMAYHVNLLVNSWWGNMGTLLCLVTSTFSYTKNFFLLCVTTKFSQRNTFHKHSQPKRLHWKTVTSTLWTQVTLAVCYLPYFVAVALIPREELPLPNFLARQFGVSILFLNSSLNPLLYCWKISDGNPLSKNIYKCQSCSQTNYWLVNQRKSETKVTLILAQQLQQFYLMIFF